MSLTAICDGRSLRTDYHSSGARNREKTHCPSGHAYGETPKRDSKGKRVCGKCAVARMQRKRADPLFKQHEAAKMQKWRKDNREEYLAKVREDRRKKKVWLDSQKVKCARCPETHPACMDFHHRDPSQKDGNLSQMVAKWSIEKLQAEVNKCDVLCANCHRKLHYDEKNA